MPRPPPRRRRSTHCGRSPASSIRTHARSKRLVNAYGVTRDIEILAGRNLECDEDEQQLTAHWTVLELRWPELAKHLSRNPSHVEYVGKRPVPFDVPRDLRSLFTDDDVRKVVGGEAEGIEVKLDAEGIEKCIGRASPAALVS
jgi:hypothetical protein